ncbi:MAG: cob(I)yrinic acid a,c-diamide adenosyltransferase [Desulfobacteraceae bacterium]
MKVYTGTGDGGKTSLFSGERIAKTDARIEAYGDLDELNAVVGSVVAALPRHPDSQKLKAQLMNIQSTLFQVGALLATSPGSPAADQLVPIKAEQGRWLEERIDAMDARLVRLNAFIIPGGHPSAAWSHIARTVCRRVERRVVKLASAGAVIPDGLDALLIYLNRLSDYFFVLARFCNNLAGVADEPWQG